MRAQLLIAFAILLMVGLVLAVVIEKSPPCTGESPRTPAIGDAIKLFGCEIDMEKPRRILIPPPPPPQPFEAE